VRSTISTPAGAATTLCELVPLFEAEAWGNCALNLSLGGRDAMRSALSTPAGAAAATTLCDDIGTPVTEITMSATKDKFNSPLAKMCKDAKVILQLFISG
jgi:hypothetical protein